MPVPSFKETGAKDANGSFKTYLYFAWFGCHIRNNCLGESHNEYTRYRNVRSAPTWRRQLLLELKSAVRPAIYL